VIAFIAMSLAVAPDMSPIDIPYQIMPAYSAYTQCVSARLRADPHFKSEDAALLRQANGEALAACRDVRQQQLARALELMTDFRPYGSRERGQAAVRRAFDRFDSDYTLEPIATAAASPSPPPPGDPVIKCAFDRAAQLATASSETPEEIADKVASACAPAASGGAPLAGFALYRVRYAATAMVKRQRGLDGQPADAPFRLPDAESRFTIPDELVPAVVPYIQCLMASAGTSMRENGRVVPPPVPKGFDCSGQRRLAAAKADDLLRRTGRKTAEERRALIESTLGTADTFVARSMLPPMPPGESDASNH
jgi:hypothetical protein